MRELMNEIELRFFEEIDEDGNLSKEEVKALYAKVSREVYLEKLSQVMDRNN